MEFNIGDKVKLPLNETGTIVKINDIPWGVQIPCKNKKSNI